MDEEQGGSMGPNDVTDESEEAQATTPPPDTMPTGTIPSPTSTVAPQEAGVPCPTCGGVHPAEGGEDYPYVYAIGRIQHNFASIGDEREFAQVTGRTDASGLTDQQALAQALAEHRYLARRGCYVLSVGGVETYILLARDPHDVDLLVEAVRPKPSPLDLDVVVGVRGPIATLEMCNGLMVPIVYFDQLYSFDRATLQKSLPRPKDVSQSAFADTAEALMDRILQLADNAGSSDEHRALNYLAVRYERIYSATAEAHQRNQSLTSIDVYPTTLTGVRRLVDVVFSYTDRGTDVVDRWAVRVDVSEEFPYLVTKLSPYTER
jgi:cyclic patellamide precursor peptide PatG